jgi:AmmeMemoRadiSam system protein B
MMGPAGSREGAGPVRPPAAAGSFYPDRPERAHAELGRLLAPAAWRRAAAALVVPHAAWQYSGRVAGRVYARAVIPRLVVILGPNHTGLGPEGSVMARGRWAVTGGEAPIAEELARAILAAAPALEEDELAHRSEHAIEVQLPFLLRLQPRLAFVPITLMRTDLDFCEEVGRALASVVRALDEPVLLICSTDLNHYESQAASNRKDSLAIEALLSLDPALLIQTVNEYHISMCGVAPAAATLAALRGLAHGPAALVRYETSGDVSGDLARVVGYAGLIVGAAPAPAGTR